MNDMNDMNEMPAPPKCYAIICSEPTCNHIIGYSLHNTVAYQQHNFMCWNCMSDFCDVSSLLQLGASTSNLPTRNDLAMAQAVAPAMQQRMHIINFFRKIGDRLCGL